MKKKWLLLYEGFVRQQPFSKQRRIISFLEYEAILLSHGREHFLSAVRIPDRSIAECVVERYRFHIRPWEAWCRMASSVLYSK